MTEKHLPGLGRPGLSAAYGRLLFPGGAAAEEGLGLPVGTTHLLEHLLYRQNSLHGSPLDPLGLSFGLVTTPEYLLVAVDGRSDAVPTALDLIESWWQDFTLTEEIVELERRIVSDENRQVRSASDRVLWRRLAGSLGLSRHLTVDACGDDQVLTSLSLAELSSAQQRLRALGSARVLVTSAGGRSGHNGAQPRWRPREVRGVRAASTALRTPVEGYLKIQAGRPLVGRSDPRSAMAYGLIGLLQYGRTNRAHRAFHEELGLRRLDFELRMFHDSGCLVATAYCPGEVAHLATELLEELLATVDRAPAQLRARYAATYLGTRHDDPSWLAAAEAVRTLFDEPEVPCDAPGQLARDGGGAGPWTGEPAFVYQRVGPGSS